MSEGVAGLDFSTIIASTVHDMKNSLAMLTHAHAQVQQQLPQVLRQSPEQGVIEYEFARLNGMLVQLLGLYKLDANQLPLRPEYHEVEDLLQAQVASHQEVLHSRKIKVELDLQAFDLMGFFDLELLNSVVANVITNSIRYAHSQMLIQAWQEDGQLVLSICDDGQGYPPSMLEQQGQTQLGINCHTGSTGLGLYFARRIAELHQRQGVRGRIELSNGGPLGGGVFRIYLP
jgi:signal transduction histidine kinase